SREGPCRKLVSNIDQVLPDNVWTWGALKRQRGDIPSRYERRGTSSRLRANEVPRMCRQHAETFRGTAQLVRYQLIGLRRRLEPLDTLGAEIVLEVGTQTRLHERARIGISRRIRQSDHAKPRTPEMVQSKRDVGMRRQLTEALSELLLLRRCHGG